MNVYYVLINSVMQAARERSLLGSMLQILSLSLFWDSEVNWDSMFFNGCLNFLHGNLTVSIGVGFVEGFLHCFPPALGELLSVSLGSHLHSFVDFLKAPF